METCRPEFSLARVFVWSNLGIIFLPFCLRDGALELIFKTLKCVIGLMSFFMPSTSPTQSFLDVCTDITHYFYMYIYIYILGHSVSIPRVGSVHLTNSYHSCGSSLDLSTKSFHAIS